MLTARNPRTWTWHQSALVLLLVGAAFLLFRNVDQGFPYLVHADEWQLHVMSQEISELGHRLFRPDYSPGFVYVLVGEDWLLDLVTPAVVPPYVKFLFGRFTSAALGLLTLSVLFACGKRFGSPLGGLLAGAYVAFFPEFVIRAHTLMPDTGATFWGVVALWTALLAMDGGDEGRDKGRDRWLAASVVAGLLAFVTKFNALPAIGIAPLAALLKYGNRPRRLLVVGGLVVLGTLAGMALLHWRIDLIDAFQAHNRTSTFLEKRSPLQLAGLGGNWETIRQAVGVHTLVIALGVLVFGLAIHRRWTAGTVKKLLVIVVFCLAFFLGISLFEATYLRDMLLVVLPAAILWGLALDWVLPAPFRVLAVLAGILLILPGAFASVRFVQRQSLPHTAVLAGEWFLENVPQGGRIATEEMLYIREATGYTGAPIYNLGDVYSLRDHGVEDYRGWGVEYLVPANRESQQQFLAEGLPVLAEFDDEERRGPPLLILAVPPLQGEARYLWLGEDIAFRGYDVARSELQPGFVLEFTLYWMSVHPTSADYVVEAQLVPPDGGEAVATHESQPDTGSKPTSTWEGEMQFIPDQHLFVIPSEVPPGTYDLQIALYDAQTGERLPVIGVDGQFLGDSFSLTEITITR